MKLLREAWFILLGFLEMMGACGLFFLRIIRYMPYALRRPGLIFQQVFTIGAMSLVLIMVSGLFVGMVLGLQGFNTLNKFGSTNILGTLVALGLLRELGPVITALLYAGRAGTALTSEIGLMRATEQLAGMEMMAVDPVRRIVVPRFLGGVISMPLLVGIFNAVGLLGGYYLGVIHMHVDQGSFWSEIHSRVDFREDFISGVIKSFVFGVAATLIAVFEGYYAQPTAEGVSRATTRTVVNSAVVVLALDFLLTALMF